MPLRQKIKKENNLILLFFSFFFACACAYAQTAEEAIDQRETREEVSNVEVTTDSEKPESEGNDNYIYDPRGKTDPFKSFIALAEDMEEKKRRKPRTYLETVELSQLQLTMIITSKRENWAMVRDSKGLGHLIKKGTFIGTDGGFVHEITDEEVIIREEYRDFRGNTKHRDRTKRLPSIM